MSRICDSCGRKWYLLHCSLAQRSLLIYHQDWIFCVENKVFVNGLFEFYLDRFASHTTLHQSQQSVKHEMEGEASRKNSDKTFKRFVSSSSSSVAPKSGFLSRLGALNHPDSWTLEYIALHGHNITRAINDDDSGFILIDEVNAFTQQIPKGWTLPQWCAYYAAGMQHFMLFWWKLSRFITHTFSNVQDGHTKLAYIADVLVE